jgi:hypothetical protein
MFPKNACSAAEKVTLLPFDPACQKQKPLADELGNQNVTYACDRFVTKVIINKKVTTNREQSQISLS